MTLAKNWLKLSQTSDGRAVLAQQLKGRRLSAGLSQLQLAQMALGATKSHAAVSRIEQQKLDSIPADNVKKLADYLAHNEQPAENAPSTPSAVWLGCLGLLRAPIPESAYT